MFYRYITYFSITKASRDDIEALEDLVDNYYNSLLIINDKGYKSILKYTVKILHSFIWNVITLKKSILSRKGKWFLKFTEE